MARNGKKADTEEDECEATEIFATLLSEDSDQKQATSGAVAPPEGYFPRHLHGLINEGLRDHVDETEFLAVPGPKVVLGEPGMGKTELIREFGKRLDIIPIPAVRFILSKDPAKFVVPGKPLLIDALDEAMSRREGDAIDLILAHLEAAGAPDFILSCRAREWQARGGTSLAQLYGSEPTLFTLEPLSWNEALAFLRWRHASVRAETVLDHLDKHKLAELYSNPLTLDLMGRVAESDTELPATRAALFERVCELIWPEHNSDRQETGLAQLAEEEALAAAGAICAALLFSGAEAVSTAGAAQVLPGDIRVADVENLPDAQIARTVLSSKLFQSAGVARIKPIHRVIAEFLAARWFARQTSSPRTQRRLLAQLHGGGAVPASLRGLHAWLAYHSPDMAERVLRADPFGILRYGEANAMSAHQADCLFEALCALPDQDPYFRSTDWDSHTAGGMMIPALRDKIAAVIGSSQSNTHLRSLLIEGVKDTPIAADLATTLEEIVLSKERFYREREDAAEALFAFRDQSWWLATVEQLRCQGGEDSTRLARTVIEMLGVSPAPVELLVSVIFAEMGLTISPLPRVKGDGVHTVRHYGKLFSLLSSENLIPTLDLIAEYAADLLPKNRWQEANDIADIISSLITRVLEEGILTSAHADKLWRWLATISESSYHRSGKDKVAIGLAANDGLRRSVQSHVLHSARAESSLWMTGFELDRRLVGLWRNLDDVAVLLEQFVDGDNRDETLREDWRDLVRIASGREGIDPSVRDIAARFIKRDNELQAFFDKQDNPSPSKYEREQERKTKEQERKHRARVAMQRQEFQNHRAEIDAGEVSRITAPAEAYLGRFSDIPKNLSAPERIADWLGEDLRDAALAGFEAVLHRSDLPTPQQVSEGLLKGTRYNFSYSIMAGMLERERNGKGVDDLPAEVCVTALLLSHNDWAWRGHEERDEELRQILEARVFTDLEARKDFCRLWIEPPLAARHSSVPGLYKLAHEGDWHAAGAELAAEWLEKFVDVPENVELELVDCLTYAGALDRLAMIAEARSKKAFRSFEHMLGWLAIEVLVRFEAVRPNLNGIGSRNPEFIFYLRNRVMLERRGVALPLSVAQREWIISEFRNPWPHAVLRGSGSGDTNPYDATDFFRGLISQLADDTSFEASEALRRLSEESADSYTDLIRHMAAEQRQKRAEEAFEPLAPSGLSQLIADGPPSNTDDLKSLVLEELSVAQRKLLGEDIDQVRDFWTDDRVPRDENRCRDRLAAMIGPELARYDVIRITEADMPNNKRADLAYARGQMQLPMEVKGQWHEDVWDAASGQLDVKYLIDWRSEQRGIYCVLWFGDQPAKDGRRLKAHPDGLAAPSTPEQMRSMLIHRIPEPRRPLIDVVVLDLNGGHYPRKPKKRKTSP